MDANTSEWINVLLRWIHVVAGITWIGHLYFFNFVNGPLAATYDADSKKKVAPQLMPRALYWFRWGAAWTWVTGFLLLGIVYYMGGVMVAPGGDMSNGAASGIGVALLVVGFVVYTAIWQSPLGKNEMAGTAVSFILLVGTAYALTMLMSGRAMMIHIGAMLGTIMAANVWMKIWPAQRKIVAAMRDGTAPDAALAGMAKLRSKHNTYMSVPLVYTMISNHHSTAIGDPLNWAILAGVVAVGWFVVMQLYKKAGGAKPSAY
jgi:uncharacterized membrane protein